MTHILIRGTDFSLDSAEDRVAAAKVMRAFGIETSVVYPNVGVKFHSDGLVSFDGAIDASAMYWALFEGERDVTFVPTEFALSSVTEKVCRPVSPAAGRALLEDHLTTAWKAHQALREESFMYELDQWAKNEPTNPTPECEYKVNARVTRSQHG